MSIGTVHPVDIGDEMRSAYLDYAMSVIVSRALPDVRDGLKPVQRRILYAMYDMGLHPSSPYKKSARIVGEVLGKYHPHGDQAVYDAMVRMAQPFSLRYPLVDGQGNFGSVDGDGPAAMRYTEARLAPIAEEMLADIDKDTVDFVPNFDATLKEPATLPAKLPNLLLNGSTGIAVGMATNFPPHNLREIAAAVSYLIDNYDRLREITVDELMAFVKGPDFPTGAIIVGAEGIRNAYATGRGRLVVRAQARIEEMNGGRARIVITEIPYQVTKSTILERIAHRVRTGRLDMIADLRDESDRRGLSIVIELKRGAQPRKVLNQLLKYTPLQVTMGVQLLALVDGEPRLLSLKRALQLYVEHRRDVIVRRSQFELAHARARAHILEGLLIALANMDEVIATIRASADAEAAKDRLISRFSLTEEQAQAILDMQLRRLAALERVKLEEEHRQLVERIAELEALLADPRKVLNMIRDDLNELAEKYGDERRTLVAYDAESDFDEADLVQDEDVVISITRRGYIKRVSARAYRSQRRGGRGVTGMAKRDEDVVEHIFTARSLDAVLFFSDRGKVYRERAYQIPDAGRASRGVMLAGILTLEADEKITAAVPIPASVGDAGYLVMVTEQGRIKKVPLSEFAYVRPSGIIAIRLDEGDRLSLVALTDGDSELILVSANGYAVRFHESQVRPMGRNAAGVAAIRLEAGDRVAALDVIPRPEADLLIVTAKGYGKRVPLSEYRLTSRNAKGVTTLPMGRDAVGEVVAARVAAPDDDIILITAGGIALRMHVGRVPRYKSRRARGVRLMSLADGDLVTSVALVKADGGR